MIIWKDVIGLEDAYKVSNIGNVKNKKTGRILSKTITKKGYIDIQLSYKNKKIHRLLHRLIAEAFIPNFDDKLFINHIDGDKQNNNISNLEWCTCSENIRHAYNIGLHEGNMKRKEAFNNPRKQVVRIEDGKVFESIRKAEKESNISRVVISNHCKNKVENPEWQYI